MIGRRIPVEQGLEALEQPGDYIGPLFYGETIRPIEDGDDVQSILFLAPLEGAAREGQPFYRVASPPHTFRECDDGSLEVRASIVCFGDEGEQLWHGFLDEGHVWRQV